MPADKSDDINLSEDFTLNLFIQKAQRYCVFQERSIFQTEQKLKGWGAGDKTISKVLKTLHDNDFINQDRFIEAFVRGKLKQNKWGKIKITVELKAHRIPEDAINKHLKQIDDSLYKQILKDIIVKKYNELINEKNLQLKKQKLINYCLSKGFEFENIDTVLKSLK